MQSFDSIRTQILDRRERFAREGSVVATWRTRGGRRFGPYYRLAYREAGRQRSLYLGASASLADQVRGLLAELQQPLRYDRLLDRLAAQARASLRQANAELNRVLGTFGFYLKGHHEFRRLHGAGAVASPLRNMVSAWILHSRTAFSLEKSRVVDQQERGGQAAVGSGRKCGHESQRCAVGSGQRCRETRHLRPEKSSCRACSCLPNGSAGASPSRIRRRSVVPDWLGRSLPLVPLVALVPLCGHSFWSHRLVPHLPVWRGGWLRDFALSRSRRDLSNPSLAHRASVAARRGRLSQDPFRVFGVFRGDPKFPVGLAMAVVVPNTTHGGPIRWRRGRSRGPLDPVYRLSRSFALPPEH